MIKARDLRHLLAQICGSNTYVNVWNCTATFVIGGKYEDELQLTDEQKEALEKLKQYIIYTVNDGAINFSGQYQLDELSLYILSEILQGNTDAIDLISKPTEEDIRVKAEELIEKMEEGDYAIIRNSAIDYNCWEGCQGYHNIQYVAMLNGKFVVIDNGEGHHVYSNADREIIEEISKEQAIELLSDFIQKIAERYNFTKAELENYELDSIVENADITFDESGRIVFRSTWGEW